MVCLILSAILAKSALECNPALVRRLISAKTRCKYDEVQYDEVQYNDSTAMHLKIFASLLASAVAAVGAPHPELLVSAAWLSQHLNDPQVAILHVSANRTAYDAGHIPGARFIPLGDLAITRNGVPNELPPDAALKRIFETAGVSDNTRVVVYGDTSVLPATRAFFTLDYLGHGSHALLDGGLGGWTAEGRPVTKEALTIAEGHLTFTPGPNWSCNSNRSALWPNARKGSRNLRYCWMSVRPPTSAANAAAHIPTAVNASWIDSQLSAQNQTLKPADELQRMYQQFGLKTDMPVITYCNSGMQASQSYFTLKIWATTSRCTTAPCRNGRKRAARFRSSAPAGNRLVSARRRIRRREPNFEGSAFIRGTDHVDSSAQAVHHAVDRRKLHADRRAIQVQGFK